MLAGETQREYNGHTWYDYEYQQRFVTKADVESKTNLVWDYIKKKHNIWNMYSFTNLILDKNREFTQELKNRGYDGTIQSESGDEACAFYPEQIKLITNEEPSSDADIRYSVGITEDEYVVENNVVDASENAYNARNPDVS